MSKIPAILDLWDFKDISEAETVFREWMAKVPDTEPYHYELKTQLARTFSLRSQFDEAHHILDEMKVHKKLTPAVNIRYCLERGRTYNSANQQSDAIPLFEEAWKIAVENKLDYLAVDAAHMMAIAVPEQERQIEWHTKSMDYAEESAQAEAKQWFGAIYNNLGWTYHDMGDYEQALTIFEKSVKWREEQGDIATFRIAKYTYARTLRSLERYDEALTMQEALLADYYSTDDEDGFVSEEIGECLLALNREAEAKHHFKEAYHLLKSISWVGEERLERIKQLAE